VASTGWILPLLHDPDGHEVRFYTVAHHTEPDPSAAVTRHQESAETPAAGRARHAGWP
jgi:hypothetical protein